MFFLLASPSFPSDADYEENFNNFSFFFSCPPNFHQSFILVDLLCIDSFSQLKFRAKKTSITIVMEDKNNGSKIDKRRLFNFLHLDAIWEASFYVMALSQVFE